MINVQLKYNVKRLFDVSKMKKKVFLTPSRANINILETKNFLVSFAVQKLRISILRTNFKCKIVVKFSA
jgi:hypothetical protein